MKRIPTVRLRFRDVASKRFVLRLRRELWTALSCQRWRDDRMYGTRVLTAVDDINENRLFRPQYIATTERKNGPSRVISVI